MNQNRGSYTRLEQLKTFQSRMSAEAYQRALHINHTPVRAKVKTWLFAKLVNVVTAALYLFLKRTRGDLSVLDFELLALGYFEPLADTLARDTEVAQLSQRLSVIVGKLRDAGMYEKPDVQHPLVINYLGTVNEIEAFIQRVHREYRQKVTLKGALSQS